jgi:hypothetical protein
LRMPSSFSVVPRSSGTCGREHRYDTERRSIADALLGAPDRRSTHILGMLLAIVQHEQDLDLFTDACQRSYTSKAILQRHRSSSSAGRGHAGSPGRRSAERARGRPPGGGCQPPDRTNE